MPIPVEQKPSLEDLLKIKRLETPQSSFWPRFEKELKQKRVKVLLRKDTLALRWLKSLWKRVHVLAPTAIVTAFAWMAFLNHTASNLSMDKTASIVSINHKQAIFTQKAILASGKKGAHHSLNITHKPSVQYILGTSNALYSTTNKNTVIF